jgi:L-alanine-DL-glutamate epimerase-like enolase superfamily enzyme
MAQWRLMIDIRAVDTVQPDVCYIGGINRALKVAHMAHKAGLICTPHAANRTMLPVFTAHLLMAIPNVGPTMESSIEGNSSQNLFTETFQVLDGTFQVPVGPC